MYVVHCSLYVQQTHCICRYIIRNKPFIYVLVTAIVYLPSQDQRICRKIMTRQAKKTYVNVVNNDNVRMPLS